MVINFFIKLIPSTLKYRLFLAFMLFILLPFSVLTLANFSQVETLMQQNTIKQNQDQLDRLKTSLEDYIGSAVKTRVLLQQDPIVTLALKAPDTYPALERRNLVEGKLLGIINSFFLSSPSIYFTLLDLNGNAYNTFLPSFSLDYNQIAKEKWFVQLTGANVPGDWLIDYGENYVRKDITASPQLMTFYTTLKDSDFQTYAVIRISLDYYSWFAYQARVNPTPSTYYLITTEGKIITPPGTAAPPDTATIRRVIDQAKTSGNFIDSGTNSIYNFNIIPAVNSYLVSQVPQESIFNEINDQKNRFFLTVLVLTLVFILISFGISATITRPLANLQKKMSRINRETMKVLLPEKHSSGEVLELVRSFNQMLIDLNISIEQSKRLERQKESLRFQALVAQMNPHFLLNTLNNIKWMALRDGAQDVADICIALGKVLETSLNLEVDLVTLQTEVELVKAYISIQEFRFDQSIDITYEYDPRLHEALVPKLCLQLLVENTISHGFAMRDGQGYIIIRGYLEDEKVTLEVEDNGVGFEAAKQLNSTRPRKGIGLSNLKERLTMLYDQATSFEVVNLPQGSLVRLTFPFVSSQAPKERSAFDVEGIISRG